MYRAREDNVVCSLFGGNAPAIQQWSETPFVHERMKTLHTSLLAIELNPRCYGQAFSKQPSTDSRNEST